MDQIPTQLNAYIYTQVTPEQVRHTLTNDGWSSFDFGPLRIQVPTKDLTRVSAAIEVAEAISGQAGFWASDLREIRDRLAAAEIARLSDAPEPLRFPTAAPEPPTDEPKPDEPFGGDDPALDAAVEKVATMPETRRRTPAKEK